MAARVEGGGRCSLGPAAAFNYLALTLLLELGSH